MTTIAEQHQEEDNIPTITFDAQEEENHLHSIGIPTATTTTATPTKPLKKKQKRKLAEQAAKNSVEQRWEGKPAPAVAEKDKAELIEQKKQLLHARINEKSLRRTNVMSKIVDDNKLTEKQQRQIHGVIKNQGMSAALNMLGINDPAIQYIIEQAYATGEINDPARLARKLNNVLAMQKAAGAK